MIEGVQDGRPLVSTLARGWVDAVEEATDVEYPNSVGDVPAALESSGLKLSDALLAGFTALAEYSIADRGKLGAPFDAASILMARGVAAALLEMQHPWRSHIHAKLVFEHNPAFWHEFNQLAINGLRHERPEREAWIRALGSVGETANDYAMMLFSEERKYLPTLQKNWEGEQNPYSVWVYHPWQVQINGFADILFPLSLMLKSGSKEWVDAFERLPLPGIKEAFLDWAENTIEWTHLEQLASHGSPVFIDGTWTRKTATLYAPFVGYRKAVAELFPLGEEIATSDGEVGDSLKRVFQAVCNREGDGAQIAWAFQEWLVGEHERLLSIREKQSRASWLTLNVISEVLADVHDIQRKDGNRVLLCEILVGMERDPARPYGEVARGHWDRLVALLDAGDKGIFSWLEETSSNGKTSWFSCNTGYCLLGTREVRPIWAMAWEGLELQRERSYHIRSGYLEDPILGSVGLIEAGLGTFCWGTPVNKLDDAERFQFWCALLAASHSLWLYRNGCDVSERTLLRCMLWAGKALNGQMQDCLKKFIGLVGENSEFLSKLASNLTANGMDSEAVNAYLNEVGVNLETHKKSLVQWEELSGRKLDLPQSIGRS
jgi:hypothetical protein